MLGFGYYRMQQNLFTTNYAHTDNNTVIPVIWARVLLDGFEQHKQLKKLRSRNKLFELQLHPAKNSEEIEALYSQYRIFINFDGHDSVQTCLYGNADTDFFPGRMWEVRDNGKLIAVGYFDEGFDSCAGILNFFDPDYKKYSLGSWLYFESVAFAARTGKTFFYPGYIGLNFPKFDYKLDVGSHRVELWHPGVALWLPFTPSILLAICQDNAQQNQRAT